MSQEPIVVIVSWVTFILFMLLIVWAAYTEGDMDEQDTVK